LAAHAERQRKWRAENPELSNASAKKYRESNRDEVLEKQAKYYRANAEKIAERRAACYAENREEKAALQAKYRAEDPEKAREVARRYVESHRDEIRESRAARYKANRPKILARAIAYNAANPEKVRLRDHRRRARLKGAEGAWVASDIVAIREMQKGKCAYCRKPLRKKWHIDHIHPIAKGGSNWPKNLQLLCAPCNLSKKDKHPIVFMQERGMLL
jgi:5-methylcytosine-specific restriction endonuclease McrA